MIVDRRCTRVLRDEDRVWDARTVDAGVDPSDPLVQQSSTRDASVERHSPTVCTWLDVFPWIGKTDESALRELAAAPVADPLTRDDDIQAVVDVMTAHFAGTPISDLFPCLPARADLSSIPMPLVYLEALEDGGFASTADIRCSTFSGIASAAGFIDGDVRVLAWYLVDACLPPRSGVDAAPAMTGEGEATPGDDRARFLSRTAVRDLHEVARWLSLIGLNDHLVLAGPLPAGCPPTVVVARRRLDGLRASDLLLSSDPTTDLADLIDLAIIGLSDPRFVRIAARRVFSDTKSSLEEIGNELGLTRERVRQLEAEARSSLLDAVTAAEPVAGVFEALHGFGGVVCPLADMISRMPSLESIVPSVQQPVWRVLDCLDETLEIADGWCARPSLSDAERVTKETLAARSDAHGVVDLAGFDLVSTLVPDGHMQATKEWLAHCGIIVHGDYALTKTRSMSDYAAAVLAIAGEALSSQEIVDRFDYERSYQSLRNQLSADTRFDRVDRDKWALHEWGLEVYSGIREEIGERLDQHGGSMQLADLVEELTKSFTVTETSVIAYANAQPYQCRDGVVSRSSQDPGASKPPEKTARFFRTPSGWAYRVRVTPDHMRGSGAVAPMAVANLLGLQYGQSRQLDSQLGAQSVYWTGIQPSFGTIRRFLTEYSVDVGTDAFLVLRDDGSFAFHPARPTVGDPLAEALRLVHAHATDDSDEASRALASAIGLPETSTPSALIEGYEQRGDHDVAELLVRARDRLGKGREVDSAGQVSVDDIMRLL